MKKLFFSAVGMFVVSITGSSLMAQFDDLYFSAMPETEREFNLVNNSFDDSGEYYAYGDNSFSNTREMDEYDEYLSYRESDYDIDAFHFTNRINRNRFTRFGVGYFGGNAFFNPYSPFGYGGFNSLAFSNTRLVGASPWGVGAYDPFFGFYNRGFVGNTFIGNGFVGNGFNTFGGGAFAGNGFGFGNALYCPPYVVNNVQTNNFNNARAATTASAPAARRSGVTTTSTQSGRTVGGFDNVSSSRVGSTSVRNTGNTSSSVNSARSTTNSARVVNTSAAPRSAAPRNSTFNSNASSRSSSMNSGASASPRSGASMGGGSARSSSAGSAPRSSPR